MLCNRHNSTNEPDPLDELYQPTQSTQLPHFNDRIEAEVKAFDRPPPGLLRRSVHHPTGNVTFAPQPEERLFGDSSSKAERVQLGQPQMRDFSQNTEQEYVAAWQNFRFETTNTGFIPAAALFCPEGRPTMLGVALLKLLSGQPQVAPMAALDLSAAFVPPCPVHHNYQGIQASSGGFQPHVCATYHPYYLPFFLQPQWTAGSEAGTGLASAGGNGNPEAQTGNKSLSFSELSSIFTRSGESGENAQVLQCPTVFQQNLADCGMDRKLFSNSNHDYGFN